jgi:hypothetical protein
MTWYVARAGVAGATVTSETYGVSAAEGLGELSGAVSIGGELVLANSTVEVSVAAALDELSEGVVADSAAGVSLALGLANRSEAVSIGGELLVANSAVVGVGDAATDRVFG